MYEAPPVCNCLLCLVYLSSILTPEQFFFFLHFPDMGFINMNPYIPIKESALCHSNYILYSKSKCVMANPQLAHMGLEKLSL